MRTPTTIEALEDAMRMLDAIAGGMEAGKVFEFNQRRAAIREAIDEHYREQYKAERTRAQIRQLAAQARAGRSA